MRIRGCQRFSVGERLSASSSLSTSDVCYDARDEETAYPDPFSRFGAPRKAGKRVEFADGWWSSLVSDRGWVKPSATCSTEAA